MASTEFEALLGMMRAAPKTPPEQVGIERMRRAMDRQLGMIPVPEGTEVEEVAIGNLRAEWVTAAGVAKDAERVVLYFHGGGYALGSPAGHRSLMAHLSARSGARVLAPDYRLAPENPFPAAIEDGVAALSWLGAQGVSSERLAIGGDSAGGGLTFATLIASRDAGHALPRVAFTLSPWVDLEGVGETMQTRADADPMVQRDALLHVAGLYLGDADANTPLASPLHADLSGLPPMLIQVGDAETLLSDSTRIAERMNQAGIETELAVFPEMIHVFQAMTMLPEAQGAISDIVDYLTRRGW